MVVGEVEPEYDGWTYLGMLGIVWVERDWNAGAGLYCMEGYL